MVLLNRGAGRVHHALEIRPRFLPINKNAELLALLGKCALVCGQHPFPIPLNGDIRGRNHEILVHFPSVEEPACGSPLEFYFRTLPHNIMVHAKHHIVAKDVPFALHAPEYHDLAALFGMPWVVDEKKPEPPPPGLAPPPFHFPDAPCQIHHFYHQAMRMNPECGFISRISSVISSQSPHSTN